MKKKREMVHEKLFKQYDIDLSKPISEKPLKPINLKMTQNILESLIQKLGNYDRYDVKGRAITIVLQTKEDAENFSNILASRMIRHISDYIKNTLKEDPKDYYRVLSISRQIVDNVLIVTF